MCKELITYHRLENCTQNQPPQMHRMHLAKLEQGSDQLGLLLTHWLHISHSSYLNKHSSIGVGMRIDGPGCTLSTHVAGEGHPHPAPRRFCEERPRERRHLWPVRPTGSARRWRPLHARSRRPAAPRGSAHHYPHGRVLQMPHRNQVSRHQPQSSRSVYLRTAWNRIEARNCTRSVNLLAKSKA